MADLPSAWKLFNAVCSLTDADLDEREALVLMVLCRYTDPGGVHIHPKQRTLAANCHTSVSTITRAIASLRRKGFLEVEYHERGMVVHYKFNLAKLGLADPVDELKKVLFAYFETLDARGHATEDEQEACAQAVTQLRELGVDPRDVEREYDARRKEKVAV